MFCKNLREKVLNVLDNRDSLSISKSPHFYFFGDEFGRFSATSKDMQHYGEREFRFDTIRENRFSNYLVKTRNNCFNSEL